MSPAIRRTVNDTWQTIANHHRKPPRRSKKNWTRTRSVGTLICRHKYTQFGRNRQAFDFDVVARTDRLRMIRLPCGSAGVVTADRHTHTHKTHWARIVVPEFGCHLSQTAQRQVMSYLLISVREKNDLLHSQHNVQLFRFPDFVCVCVGVGV